MDIQPSACELVALLREMQLGRVRADDGRTYALDARTVGVDWPRLKVGQRLHCVLCNELRRVLIVREQSLLDLRGMLQSPPGPRVRIEDMRVDDYPDDDRDR